MQGNNLVGSSERYSIEAEVAVKREEVRLSRHIQIMDDLVENLSESSGIPHDFIGPLIVPPNLWLDGCGRLPHL